MMFMQAPCAALLTNPLSPPSFSPFFPLFSPPPFSPSFLLLLKPYPPLCCSEHGCTSLITMLISLFCVISSWGTPLHSSRAIGVGKNQKPHEPRFKVGQTFSRSISQCVLGIETAKHFVRMFRHLIYPP